MVYDITCEYKIACHTRDMKRVMYLQRISGRLLANIHSKSYKVGKGKVLANILVLLLVKGRFLKSGSRVHLKFDHMFNLLLCKQPQKQYLYSLIMTSYSCAVHC